MPYTLEMSVADENAEFLANFAAAGADLFTPRTIAFAHLFANEFSAAQFRKAAEKAGYRAQMKPAPSFDDAEEEWDVAASLEMVPTVEEISRCELELRSLARMFGGRSDGWGFDRI